MKLITIIDIVTMELTDVSKQVLDPSSLSISLSLPLTYLRVVFRSPDTQVKARRRVEGTYEDGDDD